MKIHFGQIYIQPGISFPFSILFQRRLSEEVSGLFTPSASFVQKYGVDWNVMFRISAKRVIPENEVRGPTVFRKDKNVEFTIFLPFDVIQNSPCVWRSAIEFLLRGVCSVFESLGFDTTKLESRRSLLAETLSADPAMLDSE